MEKKHTNANVLTSRVNVNNNVNRQYVCLFVSFFLLFSSLLINLSINRNASEWKFQYELPQMTTETFVNCNLE